MKLLFIGDLYKHPANHLETNHDWLMDLWFPNQKYSVTKINDLVQANTTSVKNHFPKSAYTNSLEKESSTQITHFLTEKLPLFDCIIAFECTKETRLILESIHAKIIFIFFSPLRFSSRQTFTLCSNNSELQQKISVVNNKALGYYTQQAHYVKHLVNIQTSNNLKPNSVLLIGQVENDLSVWNGKEYTNLDTYFDEILKLSSNYDTIYYKPHPLSKKNNSRIANSPNVVNTDVDIYELLGSDAIKHVVTVSSSVAKEAVFFNKKVTQFLSFYIPKECKNIPYTMDENFWNYLLIGDAKKCDMLSYLNVDQIDIRPIRDLYWGYDKIVKLENKEINSKHNDLKNELLELKKVGYENAIRIEKHNRTIQKLTKRNLIFFLSNLKKKIRKYCNP